MCENCTRVCLCASTSASITTHWKRCTKKTRSWKRRGQPASSRKKSSARTPKHRSHLADPSPSRQPKWSFFLRSRRRPDASGGARKEERKETSNILRLWSLPEAPLVAGMYRRLLLFRLLFLFLSPFFFSCISPMRLPASRVCAGSYRHLSPALQQ